MGAVFAATHRFTGKQVALKWMLPELARDEDAVQRFMREANAAGRISHPNVVDVYDVGQHDDGSFFLVMELLRGEPLTTALARQDLTVREVLDLLLRAMRGVAAAHRQGVVHRDLKPDNIFLAYEEDGVRREPKVLDFGISKIERNDGPVNPRLTRTGAVVGTPYYMSPEQIRGSDNLDKRADVYAFGVILYEALTGQVPFMAETYGALVLEIATGTPKAPRELVSGIPPELSQIVLKAMARNQQDRFPDMESLIHALEPFVSEAYSPQPGASQRFYNSSPLNQSSTSTPFVAEPPPREDPILRRGGGSQTLLFIGGAFVAVFAVWLVVTRMRAPDPPLIVPAPQPTAAASSPATPPEPPSVAPAPSQAPATPSVAPGVAAPTKPATPTSPTPAPSVPANPQVGERPALDPYAGPAQPSNGDTRGRGGNVRVHRPGRAFEPLDADPRPPEPPPVVIQPVQIEPAREPRPQPAQPAQPTRRARSGTLSVDEF